MFCRVKGTIDMAADEIKKKLWDGACDGACGTITHARLRLRTRSSMPRSSCGCRMKQHTYEHTPMNTHTHTHLLPHVLPCSDAGLMRRERYSRGAIS
eukprot:7171001-Pyramimonas_sp.AAC.1